MSEIPQHVWDAWRTRMKAKEDHAPEDSSLLTKLMNVLADCHDRKPLVPEVLPLVREFYAAGNEAGGRLHVVLDDGNTGAGSVEFCIREAREAGDAEAETLGLILLKMSETQRRRLYVDR